MWHDDSVNTLVEKAQLREEDGFPFASCKLYIYTQVRMRYGARNDAFVTTSHNSCISSAHRTYSTTHCMQKPSLHSLVAPEGPGARGPDVVPCAAVRARTNSHQDA